VENLDQDQILVQGLLADAERALALTEFEGFRDRRVMVRDAIAHAHQNYIDLVRRSRPLAMTPGNRLVLQKKLDRIRARLRFFGKPV
jgi:hypothetical protein